MSTITKTTVAESLLDDATMKKDDILVLPGDCLLRHEKDIIASTGTYLKNNYVYSSVAGRLEVELIRESTTTASEDPSNSGQVQDGEDGLKPPATGDESNPQSVITKRVIRVVRPGSKKVPFLEPGSIVTARVLRITSSFVKCSIHCIEDYTLKQPYTGLIRVDDIRDYDKDKITISRCFRPGDIVLARVFATGENHQFLLTTAAPELGVVIATNDWGEPLIPISLNEMLCSRTYTREPRKVAKIDMIA